MVRPRLMDCAIRNRSSSSDGLHGPHGREQEIQRRLGSSVQEGRRKAVSRGSGEEQETGQYKEDSLEVVAARRSSKSVDRLRRE
jgi:hypothetical protein